MTIMLTNEGGRRGDKDSTSTLTRRNRSHKNNGVLGVRVRKRGKMNRRRLGIITRRKVNENSRKKFLNSSGYWGRKNEKKEVCLVLRFSARANKTQTSNLKTRGFRPSLCGGASKVGTYNLGVSPGRGRRSKRICANVFCKVQDRKKPHFI